MKIFAKKSLGQNFLVNPGIIEKIVKAAELTDQDTVLEVGPGTGNLTRALVETGARVVAVEKDRRVIEDLNAEFSAAQIEIVEGDILEFDPNESGLVEGEYKIVANLPYYITSHFMRTVFEKWPLPTVLVLMVQKEVAQRMMTKPPDMNLLALSIQYYAEPEIITHVSRGSFRPEPNVDSAVIKLVPKKVRIHSENLFKIIRAGFSSKRKFLLNNLSTMFDKQVIMDALAKLDIDPKTRAENLSLEQWTSLENYLSSR